LGCTLLILGGLAGGLIASAAEGAPDRVLRAGATAADVTPPLGERVIGGFEPFPSTAIHDNLYARCLVLDNGETQIAFVICDNLGIVQDVYDEARRRIAKETKLPPRNVLMAATHTHSGTRARSEDRLGRDR
jgi:neutral ceramidase